MREREELVYLDIGEHSFWWIQGWGEELRPGKMIQCSCQLSTIKRRGWGWGGGKCDNVRQSLSWPWKEGGIYKQKWDWNGVREWSRIGRLAMRGKRTLLNVSRYRTSGSYLHWKETFGGNVYMFLLPCGKEPKQIPCGYTTSAGERMKRADGYTVGGDWKVQLRWVVKIQRGEHTVRCYTLLRKETTWKKRPWNG